MSNAGRRCASTHDRLLGLLRFDVGARLQFVNLFGDGTPGSGMTCAIWGPWEDFGF